MKRELVECDICGDEIFSDDYNDYLIGINLGTEWNGVETEDIDKDYDLCPKHALFVVRIAISYLTMQQRHELVERLEKRRVASLHEKR